MSTWNIALIKEQGVNFAVALAKDHVLLNNYEADRLIGGLTLRLGCPVALMGEHQRRLYGRKDIVRWLQSVHPSRLPWRQMHLNG